MKHSEQQHKTLGQRLARNVSMDEIDEVGGAVSFWCDGTSTRFPVGDGYADDCIGEPYVAKHPYTI